MKQTSKLGMYKPDGDDIVEVEVLNQNFDILDTAVASNIEKTNDISEKTDNIGEKIGADTDSYPAHKTLFGILQNILRISVEILDNFDEDDNDTFISFVQNSFNTVKNGISDMKSIFSDFFEKINAVLTNTNIIPSIKSQTDKIADIQTKSQSIEAKVTDIQTKSQSINDAVTAISSTTKYIEGGSNEVSSTGNLINITGKSGEIDLQFSFSASTNVTLKFTIDGYESTIKGENLMQYMTVSNMFYKILHGVKIKNSLKVDATLNEGGAVNVNYVFKRLS